MGRRVVWSPFLQASRGACRDCSARVYARLLIPEYAQTCINNCSACRVAVEGDAAQGLVTLSRASGALSQHKISSHLAWRATQRSLENASLVAAFLLCLALLRHLRPMLHATVPRPTPHAWGGDPGMHDCGADNGESSAVVREPPQWSIRYRGKTASATSDLILSSGLRL